MIPRYFGSKTGSGVIHKILSAMPEHSRYIEPFVGGGMVLGSKLPSRSTLVADADASVIDRLLAAPLPGVEYRHQNFFDLVRTIYFGTTDLVYLDPPYHPDTRGRKKYAHDLDDADHRRLLLWALTSPALVMLSGYRCALYDEFLARWHRIDFQTMTRGGVRIESLWCNFRPGRTFHDVRFLGGNFRERERIKRKRQRWVKRFAGMTSEDRAVIWQALELSATGIRSTIAASDDLVLAPAAQERDLSSASSPAACAEGIAPARFGK